MKNYTQAPLPFQGQKRRFLKPFKSALNGFSSTATYVDLFGGSGLLSHTVKEMYPNAKVIYNDFDNYSERLSNVEKTNQLISDIRYVLNDEPDRKKRLSDCLKSKIISRLKSEKGYIDWITISSNILFSMNYVSSLEELTKETLYNKVKMSDYNADGYLNDVERVSCDYRLLFERYKNVPNVVYLIDPPYLSTDTSTYSKKDYWRLSDYLNVLKCLEDTSYFYFTSNKSQIIELCDWMEKNGYCRNPFADSTTQSVSGTASHNARYEDIMIYRNND